MKNYLINAFAQSENFFQPSLKQSFELNSRFDQFINPSNLLQHHQRVKECTCYVEIKKVLRKIVAKNASREQQLMKKYCQPNKLKIYKLPSLKRKNEKFWDLLQKQASKKKNMSSSLYCWKSIMIQLSEFENKSFFSII